MVNSKKMSKSSIAVIVLSILLVLSLILGFTGAWFTDKDDSAKGELSFGKIDIEWNANKAFSVTSSNTVDTANEKLMPGSKLVFSGQIDNKEDQAYVAYQVVLTFDESVDFTGETITGWTVAKNVLTYSSDAQTVDKGASIDLSTADVLKNVVVPTSVKNAAAETKLTVTLKVVAIQTANNENVKSYDDIAAIAETAKA